MKEELVEKITPKERILLKHAIYTLLPRHFGENDQRFILVIFSWDSVVTMSWCDDNDYGYIQLDKMNQIPKELFIFLSIIIDEAFYLNFEDKSIEIIFKEPTEETDCKEWTEFPGFITISGG